MKDEKGKGTRVILECKLSIRRFDLLVRWISRDTQHLIRISAESGSRRAFQLPRRHLPRPVLLKFQPISNAHSRRCQLVTLELNHHNPRRSKQTQYDIPTPDSPTLIGSKNPLPHRVNLPIDRSISGIRGIEELEAGGVRRGIRGEQKRSNGKWKWV